jgi:hypothetical protein
MRLALLQKNHFPLHQCGGQGYYPVENAKRPDRLGVVFFCITQSRRTAGKYEAPADRRPARKFIN